jgi:hypothetical protein
LPALDTGFFTISGSLSEELLELELEEESLDSASFLAIFLVLAASLVGMALDTCFEEVLEEETVFEVVIRNSKRKWVVGSQSELGQGRSKFWPWLNPWHANNLDRILSCA